MLSYLIRRLLAVIPVMAVVVTVVFLLIHLIPGDPVSVMLGPDATPTQIEGTRKALGLDEAAARPSSWASTAACCAATSASPIPGPAGDHRDPGARRADSGADGVRPPGGGGDPKVPSGIVAAATGARSGTAC
jgi:hypothetical protein